MPKNNTPCRLVPADNFIEQATHLINQARSSIDIMMTTFRYDEATADLIHAIISAKQRGLAVSVCVDSLTYIEPKEFFLRAPKRQPKRAYQALKLERMFKKNKISFRWLGRTTNFPFSGRTHSKWLVVDNTTYSFGGLNLDRDSLSNIDYLLKINDETLAGLLRRTQQQIIKADKGSHAVKSSKVVIDSKNTILIDGGLVGDSIIYRRACSLAQSASKITLVSQYCPTGKLNRIIKQKQSKMYFNHWRRAKWFNKIAISIGMLSARQRTLYNNVPYLHAKFILFESNDGHKTAISGSHNFMFGSVIAGTREIALETTNSQTIAQLENYLADTIAGDSTDESDR